MAASDPAHATPDRGNLYDATSQAMHAAATDARLDAITAKIDDLSRQIDARFEQVDRRFEQVDKRFEQVENRLERLDDRFFRLQQILIAGGFALIAAVLGTQL
jgi:uncharacterized protein (DUF3084 family)